MAQSIITTVGGNGTAGFAGDNNPATSCELQNPFAVGYDSLGNLFIADNANNRIRKINNAGIIMTIAGNGTGGYNGDNIAAITAELYTPVDLIFDKTGNLYIADCLNNRIRKINSSGIITTIAGTGTAGYNGDNIPANTAQLNYPMGIGIDSVGNLFIAERINCRIRKVNTSGIITTIAGTGISGFSGDNGPATSAQINAPSHICFDKFGNLFFADVSNNRIRMINSSGIISTICGTGIASYAGDNGLATLASLNAPSGITIDYNGNIFISDQFNNRIRKVNTSGIITTIVGTGTMGYNGDNIPALSAELYYPEGITLDDTGNLYISDNYNHRIRKVTNVGVVSVQQKEQKEFSVSIFPNPANEFIEIKTPVACQNLKITDVLGDEILFYENKGRIDVSQWQSGVYFLRAQCQENIVTKKIIVSH